MRARASHVRRNVTTPVSRAPHSSTLGGGGVGGAARDESNTATMSAQSQFEAWFTVVVIACAFIALLKDYIQPDHVMMLSVCALNVAGVISITEALSGFANEGLLTVGALFVVAAGISATGGLDWYMGKVLGKPRTVGGAQLRLMLPIACVSGFLNNTPVVAIMIPIVLRWAEATGMAKEQLLIPLSFASVLGGTCTLIGTSTNLVVQGMVTDWVRTHEGTSAVSIGLFDLGVYGVPVALAGIAYVLVASPFLLPRGSGRIGGEPKESREDKEDLLVGARVEGWSPAVGHTVAASGLRGLPGLYLVSVRRGEALLRAIGPEFILNQGDILYFTGLIESLGKVCAEYGLMAITQEHDDEDEEDAGDGRAAANVAAEPSEKLTADGGGGSSFSLSAVSSIADLQKLARTHAIYKEPESIYALRRRKSRPRASHSQGDEPNFGASPGYYSSDGASGGASGGGAESGATSAGASDSDDPAVARSKSQALKLYGENLKSAFDDSQISAKESETALGPPLVTVDVDPDADPQNPAHTGRMVLGISANDRPGLLHDISQALNRLRVQLLHCEASAVGSRSVSIWRLQVLQDTTTKEEIVLVINTLLEPVTGIEAVKKRGQSVVRCSVKPGASIIGKTPAEADIRTTYGGAIIAVQRAGRAPPGKLSMLRFQVSDVLVFQAQDGSPLIKLLELNEGVDVEVDERLERTRADFDVIDHGSGAANAGKEFLIAVRIETTARNFIGKTAVESGLRALPGLFLVSIERTRSSAGTSDGGDTGVPADRTTVIDPSEPLEANDVMWYAGGASAIASLRRIPGLAPYSSDQVEKLEVSSHDRRLIQAVVAKTGDLVGKSIRDVKFRTRFNAVVIAVHREGARVHSRIGDVVLHPGDVLLLDAGPDFRQSAGAQSGFALISVLDDSTPPRLSMLIPSLLCALAMIALYTAGVMELFTAAILAAAVMIASGTMTQQEARAAVKWDVLVCIAGAFGVSKAMQNSGVAEEIAKKLVYLGQVTGTGEVGLLTAVYLATFLISNIVTNNAAAALMLPIAASAADAQSIELEKMAFLLMLAASASFMSPFGYQTNLMVYGPGGYVFKDFIKFGFPMQLTLLVVSIAIVGIDASLRWIIYVVVVLAFFITSVMTTIGFRDLGGCARRCVSRLAATATRAKTTKSNADIDIERGGNDGGNDGVRAHGV